MHLLNKHDARVKHICIRNTYAIFMHLGSEEEITLLEFEEAEEGNPEELPECPDHRPTSFLRGKPRSILSLPVFLQRIT